MELTPKEKAKELVERFYWKITENSLSVGQAKQCALICVDEVINDRAKRGKINFTYWQEVKQEVKKL